MLTFFQNPWVVGIGAGIISSIIVYYITNYLLRKKDKAEHLRLIESANSELISTLKPYVAEKGLPEFEVINAVIFSVSRKFHVKSDEVYSIRIICEELVREIIGNVYVSSDRKCECTTQLIEYLENLDTQRDKALLINDIEKEIINKESVVKQDYSRRFVSLISAILSVIIGTIVMFSSLTYKTNPSTSVLPVTSNDIFLIGTISAVLMMVTVTMLAMKISNKHKK